MPQPSARLQPLRPCAGGARAAGRWQARILVSRPKDPPRNPQSTRAMPAKVVTIFVSATATDGKVYRVALKVAIRAHFPPHPTSGH